MRAKSSRGKNMRLSRLIYSFVFIALCPLSYGQQSPNPGGEQVDQEDIKIWHRSSETISHLNFATLPPLCESELQPDSDKGEKVQGDLQETIWRLAKDGHMMESLDLKRDLYEKMHRGKPVELKALGGGKHPSYKVKFDNGIVGVFKPYTWSELSMSVRNEVAAYVVDQLLGFNIVPMTIKRIVNGQMGSVQIFIKDAVVAKDLPEAQREKPKLLKLFDYLVRGTDRNEGNYMYKNNQLIAIDHGWIFRTWDLYHRGPWEKGQPSNHGVWDLDKGKFRNYLPNFETYKKIKELKDREIKASLRQLLSPIQIREFIKRKNTFIHKVDKWLKKYGHDKTFNSDSTNN